MHNLYKCMQMPRGPRGSLELRLHVDRLLLSRRGARAAGTDDFRGGEDAGGALWSWGAGAPVAARAGVWPATCLEY